MSDTIIKDILASKIEDLKTGKLNLRELYPCSHITVRGVKCQNKCMLRPGDDKPKCHSHVKCKEVKQCAFTHDDENGNEVRCSNLTRSKTDYCHYHATMNHNRTYSKEYYEKYKEKIKQEKREAYLINRFDKLITKIDQVIGE